MKIGFITISDNNNIGNRLQCFAVYKILSNYGDCTNIINYHPRPYFRKNIVQRLSFRFVELLKKALRFFLKHNDWKNNKLRNKNFRLFNENIPVTFRINKRNLKKIDDYYDFIGTGSDQVWNPKFSLVGMYYNMLGFVTPRKRFAICPSISIEKLSDDEKEEFKRYLLDYKLLSCREEKGSKLLQDLLNKKCETLADPTIALDSGEWRQLERAPKHVPKKRFLLVYFLGIKSTQLEDYITQISKTYDYEIVDLLDKKGRYYTSGPSEFLYLVDNCEILITDSFHGVVFANIFGKPFRHFCRKDANVSMNSRIENLFKVLNINSELFSDNYDKESVFLTIDCKEKIECERNKIRAYLEKVFNYEKET